MAIQKSVGDYSKIISMRVDLATRIPTVVIGLFVDADSYANGDQPVGTQVIPLNSSPLTEESVAAIEAQLEAALLALPQFVGGSQV